MTFWLVVAALVWWFGTGLLFALQKRLDAKAGFGPVVLISALLVGVGLGGLDATLNQQTTNAALIAFVSAICLWAAFEIPFFTGHLTGYVRSECDDGVRGLARFAKAVGVVAYHDVALIGILVFLFLASRDAGNTVALWTFATLLLLRISAKLNLFLGMPCVDFQAFPQPVRYMTSYMRRRPLNPLFPLSLVMAAGLCVLHWQNASVANAADLGFAVAQSSLLLGITALGAIEHLFMVVPVDENRLWNWWTQIRDTGEPKGF